MSYLPTGDMDPGDWNSTRYPGVCKPTNFDALKVARDLQSQLNRCAQSKGISKISVDGDIGAGTVRLVAALAAASSSDTGFKALAFRTAAQGMSSCSAIAGRADLLASAAKDYADSLGVPTTVAQPKPPKPPSIVTSSGAEVSAPPDMLVSGASASLLGSASGKGALILGAGAALYLLVTSKKSKRSKR